MCSLNTGIHRLDYDASETLSFTKQGQIYTAPADGLIFISWRNAISSYGSVGITSAQRGGSYVYLESRGNAVTANGSGYIPVQKGETLTVAVFQGVDGIARGNFMPYKIQG